MDDERIRQHIEAASGRPARDTQRLTVQIAGFCWPGGSEDRSEPGALAWLRRWRPATGGAALPVCSCAAGKCGVCN
jgi:hypothetical protein